MADRVTDYSAKSLAYHIEQNVSGLDNAYVVTPDFNWNHKPNTTDPGNDGDPRPLPFAGVLLINDVDPPFSVGNILYERNITFHIVMCGSSYTSMVQKTADMKQSLRSATNPITNGVGIVLYNFAIVSGSFYANAGTMQVELGQTEYFGPEEVTQEDNRKYRSITPIMLTAFKDNSATLLENMGRINLTDS